MKKLFFINWILSATSGFLIGFFIVFSWCYEINSYFHLNEPNTCSKHWVFQIVLVAFYGGFGGLIQAYIYLNNNNWHEGVLLICVLLLAITISAIIVIFILVSPMLLMTNIILIVDTQNWKSSKILRPMTYLIVVSGLSLGLQIGWGKYNEHLMATFIISSLAAAAINFCKNKS